MKRKILFVSGLILELLFLGGATAVYYFSVKRMGMARHVLYLNGLGEDAYPMVLLTVAALAVVAVAAILVLFFYFKNRPYPGSLPALLAVQSGLFSALFVSFGLTYDPGEMRAYYLVLVLLFLYCLVMNTRNLAVILTERSSHKTAERKEVP